MPLDNKKLFLVIPTHPILINNKIKHEPISLELNKMQFISYLNTCLIYHNTEDGLIQVGKENIDELFPSS